MLREKKERLVVVVVGELMCWLGCNKESWITKMYKANWLMANNEWTYDDHNPPLRKVRVSSHPTERKYEHFGFSLERKGYTSMRMQVLGRAWNKQLLLLPVRDKKEKETRIFMLLWYTGHPILGVQGIMHIGFGHVCACTLPRSFTICILLVCQGASRTCRRL